MLEAAARDGANEVPDPWQYLDGLLRNMEQAHHRAHPDEPFKRPGFPRLAVLLQEAGYRTPKGHDHWWPAQAAGAGGRSEAYYAGTREL